MAERHRLKNENKTSDSVQFTGSNEEQFSWRSVEILVGLDGCGVVEAQGCEPVTFGRGDAVVIPANIDDFDVRAQWELEMLTIVLPPKDSQVQPRIRESISAGQEKK
jgi:mannose-6-phosphate isomerase class I